MEPEELELFRAGTARALGSATGSALDAALEDLGWFDALDADPAVAVSVLFEQQGTARATSGALDRVLAGALGGVLGAAATPGAVVLPALGSHGVPGRISDGRCVVRGLGTAALAAAAHVIVVVRLADHDAAVVAGPDALARRPVGGMDPDLGLVEISGSLPVGGQAADVTWHEGIDWARAVALGQLALGHELVGLARPMLELARDHALGRIQFGRPIASFQAVRHRLAESLVWIEAADGLLAGAWEDPTPAAAAMAKGFAGRAARTVARHAQQVLAGIGFTTEHPLHTFVRRTLVLDQLLGAGSVLTKELGAEVVRTGSLPAALPL